MIKIILILFIVVLFSLALLITLRNNKTYAFMRLYGDAAFQVVGDFLNSLHNDPELEEKEEEYIELRKMCHQIIDKYSYEQILFSFKPFKIESWFTPEEVEFIKRGLQ